MANISTYINALRNAVYGEDVRSALISSITAINNIAQVASDQGFCFRGSLVAASDLNTAVSPGLYKWSANNEPAHGPGSSDPALMFVVCYGANMCYQIVFNNISGKLYYRNRLSTGTWSNWDSFVFNSEFTEKSFFYRQTLTSSDDLNDITTIGTYKYAQSSRPTNAPPYSYGGNVSVFAGDTYITQIVSMIDKTYIRFCSGTIWYQWRELSDIQSLTDDYFYDDASVNNSNSYNYNNSFKAIDVTKRILFQKAYSTSNGVLIKTAYNDKRCVLVLPFVTNAYVVFNDTNYDVLKIAFNPTTKAVIQSGSFESTSPSYMVLDSYNSTPPSDLQFVITFKKRDNSAFTYSDYTTLCSSTTVYIQDTNANNISANGNPRVPYNLYFKESMTSSGSTMSFSSSNNRMIVKTRYAKRNTKVYFDNTQYSIAPQYLKRSDNTQIIQKGSNWINESPYEVDNSIFDFNQNIDIDLLITFRRSDNSTLTATDISNMFTTTYVVNDNNYSVSENTGYYDLWMFMGQSNMAGRGISNSSHPETYPTIVDGAGFEFRAISDPTTLYPIVEPFGVSENKSSGINDGNSKTGSMVTSFANAYYKYTNVPIIGVSASKGGSAIASWQHGVTNSLLDDAMDRFEDAIDYCETNDIQIRHKYVLWCQGEHEADDNQTVEYYKTMFDAMAEYCFQCGIEKIFIVRIGKENSGDGTNYDYMIRGQNTIAQNSKDYIMASTEFASMYSRGLMKDAYHYFQQAYNEVGTYAGINCANYVNTGKEPTMYDPLDNNLYFSKIN